MRDPSSHSSIIPIIRIIVNIVINNIIEEDHGRKIGDAKIRAISISKIMNLSLIHI